VIQNHQAIAPRAIEEYPITSSYIDISGKTKANLAKSPMKRKIISGLERVTASAVIKLLK